MMELKKEVSKNGSVLYRVVGMEKEVVEDNALVLEILKKYISQTDTSTQIIFNIIKEYIVKYKDMSPFISNAEFKQPIEMIVSALEELGISFSIKTKNYNMGFVLLTYIVNEKETWVGVNESVFRAMTQL